MTLKFLVGATSLGALLKAKKALETKRFFPYEHFDHPSKKLNTQLPPYDAFYCKLRGSNPLESEYTDNFQKSEKW